MPHIPLALFERILTQVDPELARDLRQFENEEALSALMPSPVEKGKLNEARYEFGLEIQRFHQQAASLEQFARDLEEAAILMRPNLKRDGELVGFRFTKEGVSVIGSQVGLPASSFASGRTAYRIQDHEALMRACAKAHDARFGSVPKLKSEQAVNQASEYDIRNRDKLMLASIVSAVVPGSASLSDLSKRFEDNGVQLKIKRRVRSGSISSAKLEYQGRQYSARGLGLHRNTLKAIEQASASRDQTPRDRLQVGIELSREMQDVIRHLNEGRLPLDEEMARSLKSGRDFWSERSMPIIFGAIYEAYGRENVDAVLDELPDSDVRSAARWMGRGLKPDITRELFQLRAIAYQQEKGSGQDDVIDLEDPEI